MRIGELIKEYCESHGMSYQKFADSCGVSKGYVSMLVRGVNNKTGRPPEVGIKVYKGIADTMGMSLSELLKQVDNAPVVFDTSAIRVLDAEKQNYSGLANLIVERLIESDNALLNRETQLSDDERRLIAAYRAADERAREDALNTLLSHPTVKEKESHA